MLSDQLLHLFFKRRWRGFETLHRLFRRKPILARSSHGVRFALNPHDYVDSVVLRDGFYETEVFNACRPFFEDNTVFWDIGGCFGLHAITAKTLYPRLNVHVFEPNPASQRAILLNARLNAADIRLWPLALGSEDGSGPLFIPADGNSGMATLYPWDKANYISRETVVIAQAKSMIDSGQIPPPNVLKLDVEGAEEAVLSSLGEHLKSPALRLIVLECSADILNENSSIPLRSLLLNAGFLLTPLVRLENTSHMLINVAAYRS